MNWIVNLLPQRLTQYSITWLVFVLLSLIWQEERWLFPPRSSTYFSVAVLDHLFIRLSLLCNSTSICWEFLGFFWHFEVIHHNIFFFNQFAIYRNYTRLCIELYLIWIMLGIVVIVVIHIPLFGVTTPSYNQYYDITDITRLPTTHLNQSINSIIAKI